ncbi:MAG: PQQ-binding-like beta-propeller repeat protein, partial [Pirellulales bacterium]|nr:PQQ-binding-like beta-propeller repeat protein [Pirellulales bacterium]
MAKPSGEAMRGLARLEALIGQRAWDDVASAANELLSAPADGWVARGPNHYIGLREAVQRRLAAMPAEGLAVYRRRSDPLADDWLRRGREQRDERLLHRVVDEAFCTSAGDDALWALGEIALEQGEHQAARATWARVHPATAGEQLAYPDSSIPLSMVRARLALAAIRAGDFAQARQEIDVIQREHPQARGRLGGEEVELVERLAGELAGALAASAAETGAADWPTLFGSDRRRNVSDAAAPADAAWQRVWSIRLATPQTGTKAPPSSLPVVADGVAYVQDGGAIRAVRADDGSGAVASGRPLATLAARDQDAGPALMTIADGRLFAVAPALGRVAGYDLRREGALVFDHSAAGEGATLAGPPIVAGQRVIVCEITGGDSAAASIACYELWTGAAAWRRSLGWAFAADELQASAPSEAALSADGGAVYVNTGLGMVAALRAADGQPLWLRTYQRVERGRARMPNPCRLQRATSIVAPGD